MPISNFCSGSSIGSKCNKCVRMVIGFVYRDYYMELVNCTRNCHNCCNNCITIFRRLGQKLIGMMKKS